MNDLPAARWLLRLLLNPGWAPLGVVALFLLFAELGLAQRFDHLLHFLGGAAIAFFLHGLFLSLPSRVSRVPSWMVYLLAFTSSCTVAVFWELGEFASDRSMGTALQQSASETVLDLLFGVGGALIALVALAVFRGLLNAVRTRRG